MLNYSFLAGALLGGAGGVIIAMLLILPLWSRDMKESYQRGHYAAVCEMRDPGEADSVDPVAEDDLAEVPGMQPAGAVRAPGVPADPGSAVPGVPDPERAGEAAAAPGLPVGDARPAARLAAGQPEPGWEPTARLAAWSVPWRERMVSFTGPLPQVGTTLLGQLNEADQIALLAWDARMQVGRIHDIQEELAGLQAALWAGVGTAA